MSHVCIVPYEEENRYMLSKHDSTSGLATLSTAIAWAGEMSTSCALLYCSAVNPLSTDLTRLHGYAFCTP
jgi:hypothetical protein